MLPRPGTCSSNISYEFEVDEVAAQTPYNSPPCLYISFLEADFKCRECFDACSSLSSGDAEFQTESAFSRFNCVLRINAWKPTDDQCQLGLFRFVCWNTEFFSSDSPHITAQSHQLMIKVNKDWMDTILTNV